MDPKSIPAFPSGIVRKSRPAHDPGADFHVTDFTEPRNVGMTLRDYFAAKAMRLYFLGEDSASLSGDPKQIAAWSYAMADAMLAAR